jgi:hypothetical protein
MNGNFRPEAQGVEALRYVLVSVAVLFAGCSTSEAIPTGEGTCLITSTGAPTPSVALDRAIRAGNKYCASRGEVITVLAA